MQTHPRSEPEYWPDEFKTKYMAEEIADYRALQQAPGPILSDERIDQLKDKAVIEWAESGSDFETAHRYIARAIEADLRAALALAAAPDILLDGMAVYEEVRRNAGHMRTSPENVSDVLGAAVRLIRALPPEPPQ